MFNANKTLVASAIAAMSLSYATTAPAQTAAWPADEGPIEILGDVVVNNTGKGGAAANFGCKVQMKGTLLGVNPGTGDLDFQIDWVQILNNGWADGAPFPWSVGCHTVTTADAMGSTLPWSGSTDGTNVTITGLYFNAPGQPGCGTSGSGNPPPRDPASSLTGQWRQSLSSTGSSQLRSASTTIYLGSLDTPATVVSDTDSAGNCLIGGVLNVIRPVGPLLVP
jgi:hypothetical protein